MSNILKKPAQRLAYELPPAPPAVASAIKALHRGEADSRQQQMALDWIIRFAAGKGEFQFYPTDRETAFSLGRCFVGEQIVGLINIDVGLLKLDEP